MPKPLLLIGLGGSGGKTIRAIKQVLKSTLEASGYSGEIPAAWQFLHIDTTYYQESVEFRSPILSAEEFCSVAQTGMHRDDILSAIEQNCTQGELQNFLTGWGIPSKAFRINQSPSDKRADARQAGIFQLGSTRQAMARSVARMESPEAQATLRGISSALNLGFIEIQPQAFIFSSIGSPSGSGLLLDVAELLKSVSASSWTNETVSFLYTPDVFSSVPGGMSRTIPNAIGVMNELIASKFVGLSVRSQELYSKYGMLSTNSENRYGCKTNILVGAKNISNNLEHQFLDDIILKFGTLFGKSILKGDIPNFIEQQIASVREQSFFGTDQSVSALEDRTYARFLEVMHRDTPPIWTFSPLTQSILEEIAKSNNEISRWKYFWEGRRSRPLVEAIPFSTRTRHSIIAGWFISRLFELVEIDFSERSKRFVTIKERTMGPEVEKFLRIHGFSVDEKDRQNEQLRQSMAPTFRAGRTVRIWNSTLDVPGWSTFPCPLLPTHQMDEDRGWVLPQLLVSAGIALVEFGSTGNSESIDCYRFLEYLGREVTSSLSNHDSLDGVLDSDLAFKNMHGISSVIKDWLISDVLPLHGAELKGALEGNLESEEIRREALLKRVAETRNLYAKLWKELEDSRWQDLPETWELKDDINLALTSIYEYVESVARDPLSAS